MGRVEAGLRPVDLARMAGLSTQQIRNYVDAGVLPPAPRTPSGYRRLDDRHRRALLTFRALSRGYGGLTAQSIMRAVHAGDVPGALALVNEAHAALHEQRLSLEATGEALEAVAAAPPSGVPAPPRSGLRVGEVAARLGVRASALRVWESAGLLAPRREPGTGYRRFGPADVRDAQMIHLLRQGHYRLPQIRPVLEGLRRTGGSEALRAALAERREELARRATAMLDGSGHLYGYLTGGPDGALREGSAAPAP
ncbi:MerR family transcriptional regulator [Actinomadura viridis]|uniref:DNA-binding transcriptional MerR regulator n=1 Tax=Actinomadura viridis TaxID=58110 RepID=A0A931DMI0_9ACTN|nr:TioE family transcriptional regulator [Actinomadura viridis]MBG6093929.1 DNA-binding transcriptional MerR regulator [Actinomadura viridis]